GQPSRHPLWGMGGRARSARASSGVEASPRCARDCRPLPGALPYSARLPNVLFGAVGISFIVLAALSMPIVFALGLSGFLGLLIGNSWLKNLPRALVPGTT